MKGYLAIILLLISALALAAGILHLFALRFEIGDVYPEYSSLRSDPLGTMALYDTFERFPEFTVRRDFSTTNQLPDGIETTYLHLAASYTALEFMSEAAFRELDRFAASGGRLVITTFPIGAKPSYSIGTAEKPEKSKPRPYRDRWGVEFEIIALDNFVSNVYGPQIVQNVSGLDLPEFLDWHSGIVFKNLHPDWKRIYVRDSDPVMIERRFGRGAVVIATDSYFLSNEAMLLDRHSDLLSYVIGSNRNIWFDEAHLGVTETPGVATLIRRYRLHWVAASVLLMAVLFIWKMSMPLLPARIEEQSARYVAGRDTATGVINLLRRSIPTVNLLETCFTEWKKSAMQAGSFSAARIQEAEAALRAETTLPIKNRDVVGAYRKISKTLQTRIHEH